MHIVFQNPEIIFYHFFPIFNLDIRVSRSLKKGQGGIQKKGTWCALSHSKRAHSVRARYA